MNRPAFLWAFSISVASTLLVLPSANAAFNEYTWSGFLESRLVSNPWGLMGDGSGLTRTDGTPFSLKVYVDETTVDLQVFSPNLAQFKPTTVSLIVGNRNASIISSEIRFQDDAFDGFFDEIIFLADAALNGTTLSVLSSVRVNADTFDFLDINTADPAPIFPDAALFQTGGAASLDLIALVNKDSTIVTAKVVPEPTILTLATLGLLGMGCGRRRRLGS